MDRAAGGKWASGDTWGCPDLGKWLSGARNYPLLGENAEGGVAFCLAQRAWAFFSSHLLSTRMRTAYVRRYSGSGRANCATCKQSHAIKSKSQASVPKGARFARPGGGASRRPTPKMSTPNRILAVPFITLRTAAPTPHRGQPPFLTSFLFCWRAPSLAVVLCTLRRVGAGKVREIARARSRALARTRAHRRWNERAPLVPTTVKFLETASVASPTGGSEF